MNQKRFFVLVLLLFLIPGSVYGQTPSDDSLIHLKVATFDPLIDGEPGIVSRTNEAAGPYYIVQFVGSVKVAWVEQIEQLGGQLLGYIPDNAHVIRIEADDVENIRSLPAVRWLGAYHSSYKTDPELTRRLQRNKPDNVDIVVVGFPGESLSEVSRFLRGLGATINDAADTEIGLMFQIAVSPDVLPRIIQNPAIAWLEPFTPLEIMNEEARRVMNVENVWQNNRFFGEGQIIAISDSGLSVEGNLNADFDGRLRQAFPPSAMNLATVECSDKTDWTDLNGHGTHVAGSVLGSGRNSGSNPANHDYTTSYAGAAPEAELVFMAMNTDGSGSIRCVSTNGSFIAKGYEAGARISSNSWGGFSDGSYNTLSSIVDNYIWQHKDYLVLFSAGNAGRNGSQTIGSPGTAKNILTIGASENNRPSSGSRSDDPNTVADFSSRGPTADGRVKPDIVSPGTNIVSVRGIASSDEPFPSNRGYTMKSGTSMATPLTAGAAALVREWLNKDRNISNPSAALLKALLIHGAFQLPNADIPNFNSGWGRTDLKNTLNAQYVLFEDIPEGLTSGDKREYTVQVVGSGRQGILYDQEITPPNQSVETLAIYSEASPVQARTTSVLVTETMRLQALPNFATADHPAATIPTSEMDKSALTPVEGFALPISSTRSTALLPLDDADVVARSYLQDMLLGGGDFEEPGWSNSWSQVWLGLGVPERTNDSQYVISGQYSLWLGGTPIEDSIWYPLQFPDTLETSLNSALTFKVRIKDQDSGFDEFCVAFTDVSGFLIDPYKPARCFDVADGLYEYNSIGDGYTNADFQKLAGQTGYLVLYTVGDGIEPHTSAFVDDIVLQVDFADVTLTTTPSSGPAGTSFLLAGQNNVPYGPIDFCLDSCDNPNNKLGTVYAEADGNVAAILETTLTATSQSYTVETRNIAGRSAKTTFTVISSVNPNLTVSPNSGEAGTTFRFTGSNFLPNDQNIRITINNAFIGTISSDVNGRLNLELRTNSNSSAGNYSVTATDSANRSASTTFQVITVDPVDPKMTVSPTSGTPGTSFTFTGTDFPPNSTVTFEVDGQPYGRSTTNGAGSFQVTFNTSPDLAPGRYILVAKSGTHQVSVPFVIVKPAPDPEIPQTGNGLYVTLVWTDPPVNDGASKTLVNNLDLRIEGPGGPYYGNGGNNHDTVNNVETIRLEKPTAGTYTIVVEATSVNAIYGSQPYALLATSAQNFGASTASLNLEGDEAVYLPIVIK